MLCINQRLINTLFLDASTWSARRLSDDYSTSYTNLAMLSQNYVQHVESFSASWMRKNMRKEKGIPEKFEGLRDQTKRPGKSVVSLWCVHIRIASIQQRGTEFLHNAAWSSSLLKARTKCKNYRGSHGQYCRRIMKSWNARGLKERRLIVWEAINDSDPEIFRCIDGHVRYLYCSCWEKERKSKKEKDAIVLVNFIRISFHSLTRGTRESAFRLSLHFDRPFLHVWIFNCY